MKKQHIFEMPFHKIYLLYLAKVEKKGRTKAEVDEIIFWLTGYDEMGLQMQLDLEVTMNCFFEAAPQMNPDAHLITGVICGHRVEEIEDQRMWKIRCLDKLIDELARGRRMERILRKS